MRRAEKNWERRKQFGATVATYWFFLFIYRFVLDPLSRSVTIYFCYSQWCVCKVNLWILVRVCACVFVRLFRFYLSSGVLDSVRLWGTADISIFFHLLQHRRAHKHTQARTHIGMVRAFIFTRSHINYTPTCDFIFRRTDKAVKIEYAGYKRTGNMEDTQRQTDRATQTVGMGKAK